MSSVLGSPCEQEWTVRFGFNAGPRVTSSGRHGDWGGRQKLAGVRGRGASQPGHGALRAKMHLNWELVPWLGGQVHVLLGWQDILRGDTCEPLCTGPGAGKAGHAGISVDVGCRGQARIPWAMWPCKGLSDTSLPDLSSAQGEATDYLPEAPGMSRKEASGRRGLDTTRSKAPAPGPRREGWIGGPRAISTPVQARVDARSLLGSHGRSTWFLPGGDMQGPSRGTQAGLFGLSKCPARPEGSRAQP